VIALLAGCAEPALLTRADPVSAWVREGWVQLVPSSHLPSGEAGRDATEVWVFLPDGAELRTERSADGRVGLVFPPGSAADRVEWRGEGVERRVVDVRGTSILDDGARWHHVYQPIRRDPHAALVGVAWPAGDPVASAVALDQLVAEVRPHRPDPDAWERQYRSKHGCDGCHLADRLPNERPGEHGLVNRGTDAQGWFTPSTVLATAVPAEAYGAWHGDRTDPHATPSCAEGREHARCDDGTVPTWTLDLPTALAEGSAHAAAHCASVAWIADHLAPDDPSRVGLADHPCLSQARSPE
jgi:hypothetical protein